MVYHPNLTPFNHVFVLSRDVCCTYLWCLSHKLLACFFFEDTLQQTIFCSVTWHRNSQSDLVQQVALLWSSYSTWPLTHHCATPTHRESWSFSGPGKTIVMIEVQCFEPHMRFLRHFLVQQALHQHLHKVFGLLRSFLHGGLYCTVCTAYSSKWPICQLNQGKKNMNILCLRYLLLQLKIRNGKLCMPRVTHEIKYK